MQPIDLDGVFLGFDSLPHSHLPLSRFLTLSNNSKPNRSIRGPPRIGRGWEKLVTFKRREAGSGATRSTRPPRRQRYDRRMRVPEASAPMTRATSFHHLGCLGLLS